MKYTIYMLKDEHYDKLFMNYDYAMANGGVNMDEYEPVYSGTIESLLDSIPNMLESLFTLFNCNHPIDYRGRSLSVSDIVVLEEAGVWFCDSVGFRDILLPKNMPEKKVWLVMGGGHFGTPTVRSVWDSEEKANAEVERMKLAYADQPLRFCVKEMEVKN